ncbi:MAG: 5-formyltetrahydrofolate cyclo-ligase [Woeseia sp.]
MRNRSRLARANMTPAAREKASSQICDRLIRSGYFRRSAKIGCYLPVDEEVDTWRIVARAWTMGKRISAPVIDKNCTMRFREFDAQTDLSVNRFGLLEPQTGDFIDPHHLDIVITPVVAFDSSGNRIGMGGGYFDRCFSFLKARRIWLRPKLIGVAFECQRVSSITPNPWDIGIFRIITERT